MQTPKKSMALWVAGILFLCFSSGALPQEVRTNLTEYRDAVTGMEFVFVKGGCFEMGDVFGDGASNENPVHEVCLKDFYLGKYEVTQKEWKKVMDTNPSRLKEGDEYPLESVSWNDAQVFIRRLNQMTGKNYRLPTEAEWEYASRSGGKREKWAGTSNEFELQNFAWFSSNAGQRTHAVGQKKPNGLGLYDMSGNILEWVADWYDENYYKNSPKENPQGPGSGLLKVLRGGSFFDIRGSGGVRAAFRHRMLPAVGMYDFGFRLGLSPW